MGGLSGIFKSRDYRKGQLVLMFKIIHSFLLLHIHCKKCMLFKGHHEFPPYNPDTLRSVYHIRNVEVFKLKQVNITDSTCSLAQFRGLSNYLLKH